MCLDKNLIENFILDNPELDELESLLNRFNIFETLNIVNTEVRHSNVLAWLLNPHENHGLSDYFLISFLKYFVSENKDQLDNYISLFDLELINLSDVEVRREWKNIDLLIIINDNNEQIVICIENKIKSSEHSDQLQRYREIINDEFHHSQKLFVYLTPDNIPPSDENWLPFSYNTLANLIENILQYKKDILNENVHIFISQYKIILRRYIVGNSEIEKICKQIYRKHTKALDLIFQYRPDIELQISEYLQEIITKTESFMLDNSVKSSIRFTTNELDNIFNKTGTGWTKSNRVVLFEFSNYDKRVVLKLYIGPGPQEYREQLLEICLKNKSLFKLADRKFGRKWHAVYLKKFLEKRDFENNSFEELTDKLKNRWEDFIQADLKNISFHFTNQ
jgi:hypothetical protein